MRNSVGMARLAKERDLFLAEPDKFGFKRHYDDLLIIMHH